MKLSLPNRPTEFEIQAFLYEALLNAGYRVRGEITNRFKIGGRNQQDRFDLVVLSDSDELLGIIEVKTDRRNSESDWLKTRQARRYTRYGVPVRLVCGMANAHLAIADAVSDRLFPGVLRGSMIPAGPLPG